MMNFRRFDILDLCPHAKTDNTKECSICDNTTITCTNYSPDITPNITPNITPAHTPPKTITPPPSPIGTEFTHKTDTDFNKKITKKIENLFLDISYRPEMSDIVEGCEDFEGCEDGGEVKRSDSFLTSILTKKEVAVSLGMGITTFLLYSKYKHGKI